MEIMQSVPWLIIMSSQKTLSQWIHPKWCHLLVCHTKSLTPSGSPQVLSPLLSSRKWLPLQLLSTLYLFLWTDLLCWNFDNFIKSNGVFSIFKISIILWFNKVQFEKKSVHSNSRHPQPMRQPSQDILSFSNSRHPTSPVWAALWPSDIYKSQFRAPFGPADILTSPFRAA